MLDLALSILFSSLIFIVFKLLSIYRINTLYALVANYITACITGLIFNVDGNVSLEILQKSWVPGTFILGVLFIVVFNLMAATSQKIGISVASVATKMSLVIPVICALLFYGERLHPLQGLGIVLALSAVYFVSIRDKSIVLDRAFLWLPLLVFLGSGIIDAGIKFLEEFYLAKNEFPLLSAVAFASAAIAGILFILLKESTRTKRLRPKDVVGGIALGIPNYFSIYYLLQAFQHENLGSAVIFTINNVGIVLLSTLFGIVLFKEVISLKNWMGIGLAIVSIVLVALL
ncbi:DMT family transporter [Flavobacteriaceae bacterium F89]|uniref:DMT family transporter n=1 Tax=Cerina litoralis TaxID=2874477 RepID=A0AAE3EVR6_9FLAO|nr:DMT family transporter [Cerina litoralis]MCG2461094.1 DMT family transporter [Cerina litoralis]